MRSRLRNLRPLRGAVGPGADGVRQLAILSGWDFFEGSTRANPPWCEITPLETEWTVYDNGMDQAIGGGSIVIHTKK